MALKGLSDLLEKYKKEEIKDSDAFETELNKLLPNDWIPKTKFNEKNEEAKTLKEQLEAQTKLVDELKVKGGLSDGYLKQIDELKADLKKKDDTYKAEIAGMRKNSAIEKALAEAKAREAKAVMPYIDQEKILVSDDGTVTGLKEQLEAVKKDHAFLFEAEETTPPDTGNKPPLWGNGGTAGGNGGGGGDDPTFKAMLEAAGLS